MEQINEANVTDRLREHRVMDRATGTGVLSYNGGDLSVRSE